MFGKDDEKTAFNSSHIFDNRNTESLIKFINRLNKVTLGKNGVIPLSNQMVNSFSTHLYTFIPKPTDFGDQNKGCNNEEHNKETELIINCLNENKRIFVHGSFGSGKTEMAIIKAKQLIKNKERVGLVVYNHLLAQEIRKRQPVTQLF